MNENFAWQFVPIPAELKFSDLAFKRDFFNKISAPFENTTNATDQLFLGIEYGIYKLSLSHTAISPAIQFFYLPQVGCGAALLAYHLGLMARCLFPANCRTEILIDWPQQWQTCLTQLITAGATPLLLGTNPLIKEGLVNASLAQNEELFFLESLNPRRVFLHTLLNLTEDNKTHINHNVFKSSSKTKINGEDCSYYINCIWDDVHEHPLKIQSVMQGVESYLEQNLPSTSLLPYGLPSFIQSRTHLWESFVYRKDNTTPQYQQHNSYKIAEKILHNSQNNFHTVVILNEELLSLLPNSLRILDSQFKEIQKKLEITNNVKQMFTKKQPKICYLAKVSSDAATQFAHTPSPVANSLWKILENPIDSQAPTAGIISGTPLDIFVQKTQESLEEAAENYTNWTKATVSHVQKSQIISYMFKLAATQGRYFPNDFEMLLAAQTIVDSNLAFEWLKQSQIAHTDCVQTSPWLAGLAEVNLQLQWFTKDISSFSIERFKTLTQWQQKPQLRSLKLREKQEVNWQQQNTVDESKYANNSWVEEDHPYSCSFPEEDFFMEDFCMSVLAQHLNHLQNNETKPVPLTTSLEEGLDFKETMRNFYVGEVYVKESIPHRRGEIGAIIFQFASLADEQKYTWHSLWQAEPHDDSHLLFYATPFQTNIIGPGIAKSEFGGFAVLPIESRPFNPWLHSSLMQICSSKCELILLASALATEQKYVLLLSNDTPSRNVTDLLKRSGKRIALQRLKDFPPDKIRKLRTFHILAEAGVRSYAHKYILKEM